MRRRLWPGAVALLASAAVVGGCDSGADPIAPDGEIREVWMPEPVLSMAPASGAGMNFLEIPPELLSRLETRAGFWAVRGEARSVELRLAPEQGARSGRRSERILRFEVGSQTLLQAPDGRYYERGDSVYITVEVVNNRMEFKFEPSGLRFSPRRPARLWISYDALVADSHQRDGDEDDDSSGRDDDDEDEFDQVDMLEESLGVWKQESSSEPWLRILASPSEDENVIRASVTSFTGFCLAG